MKKLVAVVMSLFLTTTFFLAGCGGNGKNSSNGPSVENSAALPSEKPVIDLSVSEREITANYVKSYELPTAECKSKVDKKRLPITITATDPSGKAAEVEDGYLKPAGIGKYTVCYNATDKDAAKTKADEVKVFITFADQGATITAKKGIGDLTSINDFTSYKIPEFDEVADISYDLHDWKNADFTSVKSAAYTPQGTEVARPVTDLETPRRYGVGSIKVTYTLTAKADASKKYTYDFIVTVGDVLLNEMIDRGSVSANAEMSTVVDPELKSEGYILKIHTPFSNNDWGGMKLVGPSDLFRAINAQPDAAIVLNCYNPTPYWGKFYCAVYDDGEYTGVKGNFGNKYIVAPYEHFEIVIPKNMHTGKLTIMDISLEVWEWKGEPLGEGELHNRAEDTVNPHFYANDLYILSTGIVEEDSSVVTKVWENNAIPTTLGAYTSQIGTEAFNGIELSAYDRDGLQGLRLNKTTDGDVYLDFLSDPNVKQLIDDKFAKVRPEHKFGSYFAYTVHNLSDREVPMWVMLGNGGNGNVTETGVQWLYKLTIPANGSRDVYMGASTRGDETMRRDFNCIRFNTDAVADLVINDVRIVNYPSCAESPLEKLSVTKKAEQHTEEALTKAPGSLWAVPGFDTMYDTNFSVTAEIKSVIYRENTNAEGEPQAFSDGAFALKKGFYDVTYTITEKATGIVSEVGFTLTVMDAFDALERDGVESYKRAAYGENYIVPAYDTMFNTVLPHTATVSKVEYRAAASDEWTDVTSSQYANGEIDTDAGFYKVSYLVSETNGERTKEVSYEFFAAQKINAELFSAKATGDTFETTTYKGRTAVKVTTGAAYGGFFYNDPDLISSFNRSDKDTLLFISGVNLSAKTPYICALMDDLDCDRSNERYLKAWPAPDKEFMFTLPRSAAPLKEDGSFGLWMEALGDQIVITGFGLIDANEFEQKALLQPDAAMAQKIVEDTKVTNEDGTTSEAFNASFENGWLKLSANGRYEWKLWTEGYAKKVLDENYSPETDLIAVDVRNDFQEALTIFFGFGRGGNSMMWGIFREQVIPAKSTTTVYLSYSMLEADGSDPINYLSLELHNNTSGWYNSGEMYYSNFRIVKVASEKI